MMKCSQMLLIEASCRWDFCHCPTTNLCVVRSSFCRVGQIMTDCSGRESCGEVRIVVCKNPWAIIKYIEMYSTRLAPAKSAMTF